MSEQSLVSTAISSSVLNQTVTGTFKILCVSYEARKLGAACYEEYGHIVYYLRDISDDADFSTLRYLIDRMKPTHVIANSSASKQFRSTLQTLIKCNLEDLTVTINEKTLENTESAMMFFEKTQGDTVPLFHPSITVNSQLMQQDTDKLLEDSSANKSKRKEQDEEDLWFASLQLLPRSCFSAKEGEKWLKRTLGFEHQNASLRSKMLFDVEEINVMSALGALLRHVNQLQIGVNTDPNAFITVSAFKQIILGDVIEVDKPTLRALEIFEPQNDYVGGKISRGRTTNGIFNADSLFDFCNRCRSAAGRRKLRAWFSRPVSTREILKLRHDGVSFFNQDCNTKFTQYIRSKISHIHTLNGVISRMRLGKCPVAGWRNLLQTIRSLIAIGDALREYEVQLPVLGLGEKAMGNELARIEALLSETFDYKNSVNEERFVVLPGISSELDELKETFSQLGDLLTEVAEHELRTHRIDTCSVCYLPIIGYLVLVPTASINNLDETEIEIVYTTDQSIGFKTPGMHELDQKFGDIRSRIIDQETLISNSLQELIIKRRKLLFDGIEVAATLDCLVSLAVVAHENDWCRPYFGNEPILHVQNARHPVCEKVCRGRYVPNSIRSADPAYEANFSKVKIITGPNASGKSVYLKMIGTVVYLAHVGSFVPADCAMFGPINRLMSRMYTIDLVLNGLSSFGNDIKQMANAVCMSDENSVIIIDEFGKGTMTEVGLSLLASCLNHWLENENKCPHIFVSTHFHSLSNLLHESRLVSHHLMKVIKDDEEELEFTYEFVEGFCDHSYANYTAQKMGIKREIIERATEINRLLKDGISLSSVPSVNKEEEQYMGRVAGQMRTLLSKFFSWDFRANSKEFLAQAKAVLYFDSVDSTI